MTKRLLIIPGDCLFPDHSALKPDEESLFFMAEDFGLCRHFNYHKQKLVFFLAAMRHHAEKIRQNHALVYYELDEVYSDLSYTEKILKTCQEKGISELWTYEAEDQFFLDALLQFADNNKLIIKLVNTSNFLFEKNDFADYLKSVKKPFMHTYYQRQRKKSGILMDAWGNPEGGRWSFDDENRKPLPRGAKIPALIDVKLTSITQDVIEVVKKYFPDHPGDLSTFNWAVTRSDALVCLDYFVDFKIQEFGPYEDAIHSNHAHLFHSTISPYLNAGLLLPEEVITKVLHTQAPMQSREGFIRQVLGWREFVRGLYHHVPMRGNFFNHQTKLTEKWYKGSTGILPLDDSIKKAGKFAYTHHIERLMIIGNMMLLCRIHPDEVHRWFMEMFIDSADWVMEANVYGMSQFADGGIFATKPYISGSNYILKMSNYEKGPWCEIVDGLFWLFIEENRGYFSKNIRTVMMVRNLDRISNERRERLFEVAHQFLKTLE
jgi:deoxyribodipyrimidine photolyase-related protein